MARKEEIERLLADKPNLTPLPDDSLNAETPLSLLGRDLTPVDSFFVRNNGYLPEIADGSSWTLTIDGHVNHPRTFTVEALKSEFEVVSLTSVLECAGNNRSAFDPPTDGLAWGRGAVGCAKWTGVRLRDLLHACGVGQAARYTGHHSPDRSVRELGPAISRGMPIEKALAPETLIAWKMNEAELTFLHGAPLRIVAPGMPGSVWQKWLSRIEIRDRVHDGEKMNGTDYRIPRQPVKPGNAIDYEIFEVIERMPVNSMITQPADGSRLAAGEPIEVTGFAWSGNGAIEKVEVSSDGSRTWVTAELGPVLDEFAWRRFSIRVPEILGNLTIFARATDSAGNVQPIGQGIWNPRGYCNNACHRIKVILYPQ